MNRFRTSLTFLWRNWTFILASVLLLAAILCTINIVLYTLGQIVIYPLFVLSKYPDALIRATMFTLLGSIKLFHSWLRREQRRGARKDATSQPIGILFFCIALPALCGIFLLLLTAGFDGTTYTHEGSASLGSHVYHVAFTVTNSGGNGILAVYQCDPLGFFCAPYDSVPIQFDHEVTASLSADPASGTLALLYEGQALKVYTP